LNNYVVIDISSRYEWIPYKNLKIILFKEKPLEISNELSVLVKNKEIKIETIIASLFKIARQTGRADLEAIAQLLAYEHGINWYDIKKIARRKIISLTKKKRYNTEKYGEELAKIRRLLIESYVRYYKKLKTSSFHEDT